MSSLSPRVATAIAVTVIFPATIVTIVRFDIAHVDINNKEAFRQTRPYAIRNDEPADCPEVERTKDGDDTPALHRRSQSLAKPDVSPRPVRRGPQILGAVADRNIKSSVFAARDDPFTETGGSSGQPTPEIHSLPQLDQAESNESPTQVSPEIVPRATNQYCIDSVIAVPCQPASFVADRNECCIEINLFRGISDRIFQPLP